MCDMDNPIEIFKFSITKLDRNTTYVTNEALGCFLTMKNVLESIADDLSTLLTGAQPFTPGNFALPEEFMDNINNLENFLRSANRNSPENSTIVIEVRDILIRFENIRILMKHPNTNEDFRRDAIQLFIQTGKSYPEEQIREFIGWLSEEELQHILQIVHQERTLMEKTITNTPIHILTSQRINALRTKTITRTDSGYER